MKSRRLFVAAIVAASALPAPALAFASASPHAVCKLYHYLPGEPAPGVGYFYSWVPCIAGVFG